MGNEDTLPGGFEDEGIGGVLMEETWLREQTTSHNADMTASLTQEKPTRDAMREVSKYMLDANKPVKF